MLNYQISKYFLVGLVCSIFDVSISSSLFYLGFSVFFSSTIGYSVATLINYFLSFYYVFPASSVSFNISFLKLVAVSVISLSLNVLLVAFFVKHADIPIYYSKILSIILIFIFNFASRKFFVFR